MSRIDQLPADQRAALQLLLKQGRSYDDIAGMLRIDPAAVRERARSALDALGPDDLGDLPLDRQDDIADYLLGQQSASRRQATREYLESSSDGRAWARIVSGELRPLAGENLPEIPAEAAEVDEAFDALSARTTHRRQAEQSSKIGGIILLGGLAVALVVLVLLLTGALSGDDEGEQASTGTTSTQAAAEPQIEAQLNLQPPEGTGGDAAGVAVVATQGDQRVVQLIAQGLQPANKSRFYAIWLYTSQEKARNLGFPDPQPDKQGRMQAQFALPKNSGDFTDLVITRESEAEPKQPGTIVLRSPLESQAATPEG
jgi:hypothetical protein